MAYKYGEKITRTYNGSKRTWRTFVKYTTETTATKVKYEISVGVENCSSASMSFDAKKLDAYVLVDGTQKKHTENSSKITLSGGGKKTLISSYSGSFTRGDSSTSHTIKGKCVAASSCAWHGTSIGTLTVKVPAVGVPDGETEAEINGDYVVDKITLSSPTDVLINALDFDDRNDVYFREILEYTDGEPTTFGDDVFPTPLIIYVRHNRSHHYQTYDKDGNPIGLPNRASSSEQVSLPYTLPASTRTETKDGDNTIVREVNNSLHIEVVFRSSVLPELDLTDYQVITSIKLDDGDTSFDDTAILKCRYDYQWHIDFEVQGASYPDTDTDGYAKNIKVYAFPYENGAFSNDPDIIDGAFKVTKLGADSSTPPQYTWSIGIDLGREYVDDPRSTTPNAKIKVDWENVTYVVPDGDRAFYNTTKNMNFANGLANSVFVGGCSVPNFTSRVWYSKVNEPLYFPDTNYMEVGSNDTAVYGLTKVGDYLCIVKQGKTTDTSIYLAYPTSFEDDTAYAVKQGLNGVGADSRFAFNIMNEEALFLSNIGVMAIVPTETEEKRIQNRSYFIDKKLAEENHEEAYSFVFNNMYYLAFPNGHCYVLDGNQRNSWGNDKTNLVYECYYLENVAANNFVKFKHQLWFSTDNNICRFKTDDDKYPYADGYFGATEEEDNFTPVEAEWSTKFDDDGSIHYYKTMQKKGNVVSILPSDYKYTLVSVTEEEWNADREKYFEVTDDGYERCNSESNYNGGTYYIRDISATRVYVRKDTNDPYEIQRKFNERSRIPSEMILKKKFKKYKRLQFIIRNDEDEPFGIDEIIKSYTIGNYAKK